MLSRQKINVFQAKSEIKPPCASMFYMLSSDSLRVSTFRRAVPIHTRLSVLYTFAMLLLIVGLTITTNTVRYCYCIRIFRADPDARWHPHYGAFTGLMLISSGRLCGTPLIFVEPRDILCWVAESATLSVVPYTDSTRLTTPFAQRVILQHSCIQCDEPHAQGTVVSTSIYSQASKRHICERLSGCIFHSVGGSRCVCEIRLSDDLMPWLEEFVLWAEINLAVAAEAAHILRTIPSCNGCR